ncbi:MAG: DUF1287 domain-containing protein [Deltaproteobacteria bacterium]|nr:DUF1287 domain-containing protein [Deltaproteobacteria bacterium]
MAALPKVKPSDAVIASKLVAAAMAQTKIKVSYDGSYRRLDYPGGDVPANIGVCTDVIIRAYRELGIDLQVLVHEDMKLAFKAYPQLWGLRGPDYNIDHRRVPNLQVYFTRVGVKLSVSQRAVDYHEGDLVTWMLPGNLPHIGIVSSDKSKTTGNPLIIHNIGRGPEIEDMLFAYEITGHYRWLPHKVIAEPRP